jgi:hypothetical protein
LNKNFLQVLKELLSFGSAKAVVINFSLIFFSLAIIPTAFWDSTVSICPWRTFILPLLFRGHCPEEGFFAQCLCPGCGLTHAFSALFHGNFVEAYDFNKLVFLVLAVMLLVYLKNIYKLFFQNN